VSTTEQPEPVEPQRPGTPTPEPEPAPEPAPEPGEPTEPQEPLQEPEPEPESQAVMEEIGKKLDALNKTVATRISSILGDQATDFEVCDLCSYWNTPGWRHSGHLPEDLRDQLAYLIGQRPHSELKHDQHSAVCSYCDGEGVVDTGSKVPGQTALPCVECEGMGWTPTDDARRRGRMSLPNGPTAQALGVTPAEAAMNPAPVEEPPEVAALRQQGYLVVAPIAAGV